MAHAAGKGSVGTNVEEAPTEPEAGESTPAERHRSTGASARRPSWRRWLGLTSPGWFEWVLIAVTLAWMTLSMLGGLQTRTVNADDVALQNMLDSWLAGGARATFVGTDNFLLHFPLYWATSGIDDPRIRFRVQAVVCNLVCTVGMIVLLRHLARFRRATGWLVLLVGYLPVMAWSAIALVPFDKADPANGYFQFLAQLNVNLRHLETGVWLIVLVLLTLATRRRPTDRRGWILRVAALVGLGVLTGLLFFSDPLFVYIGGGAVLVTVLTRWLLRRTSLVSVVANGAVVLGGVLVMKVLTDFAKPRGLKPVAVTEEEFAKADQWVKHTEVAVRSLFTSVHGDFSGLALSDSAVVPILLNASLVGLLLITMVWGVHRFVTFRRSAMPLTVVAMLLISGAALTLTPNGAHAINYRYLYVGIVALFPLMGAMLVHLLRRNPRPVGLVVALLVLQLAVNSMASVRGATGPDKADRTTLAIVEAVEKEGVTKGYAEYWSANPISFFSNRRVIAVGLGCRQQNGVAELARYNWLITRADLDRPTERSFVVVERPAQKRDFDMSCFHPDQLGRPTKTVRVDDRTEVLFFDGDVGARLPTYIVGKPR